MLCRTPEWPRLVTVLAGLVFTAACSGRILGFHVPRPEVRDLVEVVAIARPSVPYDVESIDGLRLHLERSLARTLESAGLRVIGSAEWDSRWRQSAIDVGGVYDAETGKADPAKHEIVRQAVLRELAAEFGVDAIAYLSIESEEHFGPSKFVVAYGRWVPVFWPGGWRGERATLVRVACLKVAIVDRGGRVLYGRRTPLEVTETFGLQTRARREPGELLRDRKEIAASLERIVEPFAKNERN